MEGCVEVTDKRCSRVAADAAGAGARNYRNLRKANYATGRYVACGSCTDSRGSGWSSAGNSHRTGGAAGDGGDC